MIPRQKFPALAWLSSGVFIAATLLLLTQCGSKGNGGQQTQSGDPSGNPGTTPSPTANPTADGSPSQAFGGYWGLSGVSYSDSAPSNGACKTISFEISFGTDSTVTLGDRAFQCGSTSITSSSVTLTISGENLLYQGSPVGTISSTRIHYQLPISFSGGVGSAGLDFDLGASQYSESGSASGGGVFYSYSVKGTPVKLAPLAPTIVRALGTGSCAVVGNAIRCWGSNEYGELGNGSTTLYSPLAVLAGTATNSSLDVGAGGCAVVGGAVQCWGLLANNSSTPVAVSGLSSGATAVSVGYTHACAIVNGGLVCWGNNSSGQLGNNSTNSSTTPVQVQGLTSGVTAVAAGSDHTCAIVNGAVYCWGSNTYGQISSRVGNPSGLIPGQVQGLSSGATALAAGLRHTCAVINGGAQCWGGNSSGQVGNNSTSNIVSSPSQVQGLTSGVTEISTGEWHSCAIVNGGAWCWGDDTYGQLGNGTMTMTPFRTPVQVQGLTAGASSITAGASHSCAIVNGVGMCWGSNSAGQLGDYSTTDASLPRVVLFQQ